MKYQTGFRSAHQSQGIVLDTAPPSTWSTETMKRPAAARAIRTFNNAQ